MSLAPRYFVIFGAQRTGSNLLETTLGALGDTVCYGEAFNPGFMGAPRRQELLGWSRRRRDASPLDFLEALIAAEPGRIPGFRIFPRHARRVVHAAAADARCARIVLRRDPLESFVSLKIAMQTGRWILADEANRVTARIEFDAAEFDAYRERIVAYYRWIDARMRAAGTSALRLRYGGLLEGGIAKAAAHIGSRGTLPETPPILRQNPQPLSEKVTNFREMCARLGRDPDAC